MAAKESGHGTTGVASLLAGERIRAAYQLCRAIQDDLSKEEIDFQKGQLAELSGAAADLAVQLKNKI